MTGAVLVAGDFTPFGGMDRANLELARYLAALAPLHLVTHRAAEELAAHPHVTVHRVTRPFGKHLLGTPFLAAEGRRVAREWTRLGFRTIVNGGNCPWGDVNWVHCVHAAYPAWGAGGLLRRVKAGLHHTMARSTERRSIRSARLVICNSRRTARDVITLLDVPEQRVKVVYFGTDAERFPLIQPVERTAARATLGWDERPWVGFVGQLGNRVKGFDTLFSAWESLCREANWDANLAVIGSGGEMPYWRQRASDAGLADRIRFLGFRQDVATILAACDAVAHPARYDAYGLAPHEALCRGLPVIVSAAAGVSERYPASLADLILTDPENPGELADRLRFWRANLDRFRCALRPFADELRSRTWTDMARDIVSLIES